MVGIAIIKVNLAAVVKGPGDKNVYSYVFFTNTSNYVSSNLIFFISCTLRFANSVHDIWDSSLSNEFACTRQVEYYKYVNYLTFRQQMAYIVILQIIIVKTIDKQKPIYFDHSAN